MQNKQFVKRNFFGWFYFTNLWSDTTGYMDGRMYYYSVGRKSLSSILTGQVLVCCIQLS